MVRIFVNAHIDKRLNRPGAGSKVSVYVNLRGVNEGSKPHYVALKVKVFVNVLDPEWPIGAVAAHR